jgi:hypothetical protein
VVVEAGDDAADRAQPLGDVLRRANADGAIDFVRTRDIARAGTTFTVVATTAREVAVRLFDAARRRRDRQPGRSAACRSRCRSSAAPAR